MKLTIKAGDLLSALEQTSMTIGKKADLPYSWMYLEARGDKENQRVLTFATDMVGRTLIKTGATVTKPGSVFIKHDLLAGFISSIPKDEDVELWITGTENQKLNFKCSAGKGSLYLKNTGDDTAKTIDTLPFKAKPTFEIAATTLLYLIGKTEFATTNDRQPILSTVHFYGSKEGYTAEATDGNIVARAFCKDANATEGVEITIPSSGLVPLTKMLSSHKDEIVKVIPGNEQGASEPSHSMYFRFSDTMYGTILMADKFPNIDRVFEGADKVKGSNFRIPTDQLRQALNRANLFAEGGHIKFDISENTLKVSSEGASRGKFDATIDGSDPEQKVTTNVSLALAYIIRALKDAKSNVITLQTSVDGSRVWLFDNEDLEKNAIYLLGCIQQ